MDLAKVKNVVSLFLKGILFFLKNVSAVTLTSVKSLLRITNLSQSFLMVGKMCLSDDISQ